MKKEIDFFKFNPTQNMTVLVSTNSPIEEYQSIASQLMSYENVYAEQVGFLQKSCKDKAVVCLQMAGGEFCGNACMAAAVNVAFEKGLKANELMEIFIEASGVDDLVECQVKNVQGSYYCQVNMPLPVKIDQKILECDGDALHVAIVRYREFFHIILEVEEFDEQMRTRAQKLAKLLGVTIGNALVGVLLFKSDTNELAPLIYVPQVGSLIWERGCGSGTASLGAYLSWKSKGNIESPIKQPGGTIHVTAHFDKEEVKSLKIGGLVDLVAQGKAFINT
jgi:diaminopimelate epimerase